METVLIVLVFAVALVFAYYLAYRPANTKDAANTTKVTLGRAVINAEVAGTLPKMMTGLMFRKSLPERGGMLFLFGSDGFHKFWMMNTSIHLDIIWISSDYKIIYIQRDAQPCFLDCKTYAPDKPARYVLEVNAGFVDKNNIKIGDSVKF